MRNYTVCVLCYGDHPTLARRCLASILKSDMPPGRVNVVIGLNEVSTTSSQVVSYLAQRSDAPITVVSSDYNVCKYPMMRRMLRLDCVSDIVVWFDDDSFISKPDFWSKLDIEITKTEQQFGDRFMLGQVWHLPVQGNQQQWFSTQSWFSQEVGPCKNIRFCQGAWWAMPKSTLHAIDWPIPELKHCGGDSLLGEVCRHKNIQLKHYDYGVRINANWDGEHSKALRRGYSEKVLGSDFSGTPYPVDHHNFALRTMQWNHVYG